MTARPRLPRTACLGALVAAAAAAALTATPPAQAAPAPAVVPVQVFPAPGTRTAAPGSQLSFRGTTDLARLQVVGQVSGAHPGRVVVHSDRRGASFVPATPFVPGETVTVRTAAPVAGAGPDGFSFTVSRPASAAPVAPALPGEPQAAPRAAASSGNGPYRSRPDLRPPTTTVAVSGPHSPGLTFASSGIATSTADAGVEMYDDAGQPVWFHTLPDLGLGTLQRIRYKGQDALTWFTGTQAFRGGYKGSWIVADSSYRQIAQVSAGNGLVADGHELRISPDGTRALLCIYDPLTMDLSAYGGARDATVYEAVVQEVDLGTGAVTFEWHSLDESPVTDSLIPLTTPLVDYFHLNAMEYDAGGRILVSARQTSQVLQLDPQAPPGHRVAWRLGGKRSSYAFPRAADAFSFPHDVRRLPDGTISVYDNAVTSTQSGRGVTYRLDDSAHTAVAVHAFPHTPPAYGVIVGSNRRLDNGDQLVSYGSSGTAAEYDPAGRLVWQSQMQNGCWSYRTLRVDGWHASPAEPPALATDRSGTSVTGYASWNGATEVASWVLLAGPSTSRLRPVSAATRRSGFETTLRGTVTAGDTVIVAEARDAAGRLLRRSTGNDTATAIQAHYNSLGGPDSFLGPATGPETAVPGGALTTYRGGVIAWSPATGAWEVHGAVLGSWAGLGAQSGVLGFPIADERGLPDGTGRLSLFQGGALYWTPATGAHEVHGAIGATWSAVGAQSSSLGYPVTDELVLLDTRGRGSVFQGGAVFWTPELGAHEVHGGIASAYGRLGLERSVLGYPTSNETSASDGTGRVNSFQTGWVYWTPTTGANEVHGAIGSTWRSLGAERSRLGYPVRDEYDVPGGRRSDFQRGSVFWNAATGAVSVFG